MQGFPFGQLANFSVRDTATYTVPARRDLRRFPTRRVATPADPFTWPPYGTFLFHTSFPVSALTANTQPRVLATYMHPSAITGVPVKSPSAPTDFVEKVQAGDSVGTSSGPMSCSASWNRVLK